jgi:hypothetical protein
MAIEVDRSMADILVSNLTMSDLCKLISYVLDKHAHDQKPILWQLSRIADALEKK